VNRSFLYVPADRLDRVAKALGAGADAVIVDLEDALAPNAKAEARRGLAAFLDGLDDAPLEVWVRINQGAAGIVDLRALAPVGERLAGLVLAKCDSPAWIDDVAGSVRPGAALAPLIESAQAVRDLDRIAGHPRVTQCQLGEIDLLAELGASGEPGSRLVDHARRELVFASAAAAILPPIGGVEPRIRDLAALEVGSRELAQLGFAGRPALHPDQIAPINAAFTPTEDAIADARRAIALYDAAVAEGVGAISGADGAMVDEAVVRRARRLLDRYG
jgi:citrate lyase subunit beta/citryl-CoA lyase